MKYLRILIIIPLLLIALPSHAKHDPCAYFKKQMAEIKSTVGVTMNAKCIPLTAMMTWQIDEYLKRHFGSFPQDEVHYKMCEAYPAALQLYYNSAGKLDRFLIEGPMPQDNKLIKTDLMSIKAEYMACNRWAEDCQLVKTDRVKDFRVIPNAGGDGIEFMHDVTQWPEGNVDASNIEALGNQFSPPEKFLRSALPEHLSGATHGLHVNKIDAISIPEVKKLTSQGRMTKMFLVKQKIPYATKETYLIDGFMELALAIGGAIDKGHSERITYEHPDPKCPYYSSTVCYDIKIDPCLAEVVVNVPIHLRKKKALPMKHITTVEDPKGDIAIYMPAIPPGGGPFVQEEVTDKQIDTIKHDAEVFIGGAWNSGSKNLVGGGRAISMRFEVEFVGAGDKPCQIVDVYPGDGRSTTNDWYFGDGNFSYTAHEYGHYLGLDDEYKDRECPNRPVATDENIMASGHTPRSRHYKPIAGWTGKATGKKYQVK